MKARILVFGNVQGVGFRAYVKHIARNMQIRGFVRNLPDGCVEIYARGAKTAIKNFIKKMDIKGKKEKPFSLHVERIIVFWEHNKNFIEPSSWPEFFEVDYVAKLSPGEKEMVEKTEFASLILASMDDTLSGVDKKADVTNSKLDRLGGLISKADLTNSKLEKLNLKADSTNNKLDKLYRIDHNIEELKDDTKSNFSKLDSSVNGLRTETKSNFGRLDRTYGRISREMKQTNKDINGNLKELNKNLTKLVRVAVLHQRNKLY